MINDELETIESLAHQCDEVTAVELNRRLRAILDWVMSLDLEEHNPMGP